MKMKRLVAFLLLILVATPMWSQEMKRRTKQETNQEMKDVPKRKIFDKKFWLATAAIVGTTVLDVETTARCLRRPACAEGNSLWGRSPSRAKMYGIKGSLAGFTIFSTWWWKRDDMRKMQRWELRLDRNTPEPRIWEKPRQSWYLPALIVSGVSGAAGFYNLARMPDANSPPVQPAKLSGNVPSP
jgi:hypothetical protein